MPDRGEWIQVERVERLEDAREEWTRLAELAAHPFASWEWNECWWRWFGAGRELYTFLCRDRDGKPAAILPLYVARARPLRIARFLGYADLHSPVCAPEHRRLAAAAMRSLVRSGPGGCRLLIAERLPRAHGWGELLGGRVIGEGHDPTLRFEGRSWEQYLAARSRNFRSQVRRRERRLVDEHGLRFRLCDDPQRLAEDMRTLFRLHGLRWQSAATGVFAGRRAEFHLEFAAIAQRRGWLRLWIAEIDDEPVAAWYGWRFAGDEWYFQAGRDPRHDELGLGWALLAHSVRAACEDRAAAYHFLAGDEAYKQRFTDEDPGSESRLLAAGAAGRLGAAAIALAVRRRRSGAG